MKLTTAHQPNRPGRSPNPHPPAAPGHVHAPPCHATPKTASPDTVANRPQRPANSGKLAMRAKKPEFLPDIGQESCSKAKDAATLVIAMNDSYPQELVRHIAASTGLPEATATRVVADVTAYFAETVEDFVRRRHEELKLKQQKNDEIWPQIAAELVTRRFGAPELSGRQLRRIVYG